MFISSTGVEVSRGLDDDNATVVTVVFPNVMLTIKTITFTRLTFLLTIDDSLKGREKQINEYNCGKWYHKP